MGLLGFSREEGCIIGLLIGILFPLTSNKFVSFLPYEGLTVNALRVIGFKGCREDPRYPQLVPKPSSTIA